MVQKVTIENLTYLRSVTLDRIDADYLLDDDGIDWGSVPSQISYSSTIGGLGSTVKKSSMTQPRNIRIVGWIITGDASIEEKKAYLSKICNPIDTVCITCGGYTIKGKLSSAIKFATATDENNEEMCKFSISIACAFPFFTKTIKKSFGEGTEDPFLIQVGGTGTIFSFPMPLENFGEFTVGAKFTITLSATYTNIGIQTYVWNHTYDGQFNLIGTFPAGTKFYVNTISDHKSVSINTSSAPGEAYKYWDLNSDWVQIYKTLSPEDGYCYLVLSVDDYDVSEISGFNGIRVDVEYDTAYLSMEDM